MLSAAFERILAPEFNPNVWTNQTIVNTADATQNQTRFMANKHAVCEMRRFSE